MSVQFGKLLQVGNYSAASDQAAGGRRFEVNYKGTFNTGEDYNVKAQATPDKFTAEFNLTNLKINVEQTGNSEQDTLKVSYENKVGTGRSWTAATIPAKIQKEMLKDAQTLLSKATRMLESLKNSHKMDPRLSRLVYDHILDPASDK